MAYKRTWLRWVAALGTLLLLLALSPVILLHFYQDQIKSHLIKALDEQFEGRIELDGLHIAPFAQFPYISTDLEGLRFFDRKTPDAKPVYQFEDLYVGLDVWDLVQGRVHVRKIRAEKGFLHLVIDSTGRLNLLEAKKTKQESTDVAENPLDLDLKAIDIHDVVVKLDNYEEDHFTEVLLKEADSRFSLVDNVLNLHLDLIGQLTDYRIGKTRLFHHKDFELHNDVQYDFDKQFVDIRPGKLVLKYGELTYGGTVDIARDMQLDLKMEGRKNSFDLFLSFIPEEAGEALQAMSSRGDVYFKAQINGPALHRNPHVRVELGCDNTFFSRKDLNKDVIKDLSFKGLFDTGDSNTLATSKFYLESLYGKPENSYIKGTFRIENFERPLVNMDIQADIDLRYLPDFMPVNTLEQSSGKVTVAVSLNEFVAPDQTMSVMTKLQDGAVSHIDFQNVQLKLKDYPYPVRDLNGSILLDGDHLTVDKLRAKVLDSDLQVSMVLDELLHFFHGDDVPVAFSLKADAKKLIPGQLVPDAMRPVLDTAFSAVWKDEILDFHAELDVRTTSRTLDTFLYIPTLAVDFHDFRFRTLRYPNPVKDIRGHIDINDHYVKVRDLTFVVGESQLFGDLDVAPIAPLMTDSLKAWVNFSTDLKSPYFDLKQLLSYDGRCMLNDQIEREIIRKLDVKGHGRLLANSFGAKGFQSELTIDRFFAKINDMPLIEKVSGYVATDTLGSIHLKDFSATIGKSTVITDVDLEHFLDNDLKNKKIRGSFKADWIDLDELTGYQQAAAKSSKPAPTKPAEPAKNPHEDSLNLFAFAFPDMNLQVEIGHFRHHKYVIDHIKGRIRTTADHYAYVDSLHMDAAGGHLVLHGYFNGSNPKNIYLTSHVRMQQIDVSKMMYKFDNFGQDYMVSNNVRGIMSGTVNSTARFYPDFTVDLRKTTAHAEVTVKNGRLLRFTPMHAMADFMGDKDLDDIRFGEMQNTFDIKDGYVTIPSMKLASSIGYMYLSGKQNFDDKLQMNYDIRLPLSLIKQASWNMMKSKLFGRPKAADQSVASSATVPGDDELVEEDKEIIDSQKGLIRKYVNVNVAGTSDNFKVSLGRKNKS